MEEDGRDSAEKPPARVNTWTERQKHTSCKRREEGEREKEREAYHLAEVPSECCIHCLTIQWKASYTQRHCPHFFSLSLGREDFVVFLQIKRHWETFAAQYGSKWGKLFEHQYPDYVTFVNKLQAKWPINNILASLQSLGL